MVSIVYTSSCCGVHFSGVCGVCVVLLWNGGVCVVVSLFVFPLLSVFFFLFFFLFVLVFGVVRAQPSEHARYPRTPLRLLFLLFVPLFSLSAFLLLEWRWGIHHVSVCLVGMTATGSLSRSSSFFW